MRKRLTIGISGFAIVATGCYYTGRTIYRSRRAKKQARMEAAQNKAVATAESVTPIVQEAFEATKAEPSETPVQEVPESEKQQGNESSPEIAAPSQGEAAEGVKEENEGVDAAEPETEAAAPTKESVEESQSAESAGSAGSAGPSEPSEPVVPPKKEEEEEEKETSQEEEASEDPEVSEVEDETWHPWWEGVQEISLFLPGEEIDRIDALFPATHPCK